MGAIKNAAVLVIFLVAVLSASEMANAAPAPPAQQNFGDSLKTLQFEISNLINNAIAKTTTSSYIQQPVDAVIVLPTKNLKKTKEAVNLIRKNGGVVSIVYVPNTIIALKLPKNIESKLISSYKAKIYRSNNNLAELKKSSPIAANLLVKTEIKYAKSKTPFKDKVLIAPHVSKKSTTAPLSPPGSTGYPPPSDPYITSYYMLGDVFVSIILPESNGTNDSNMENWTSAEESLVDTQLAITFNWWVNRSVEYNVSYPLTFWIGTNSSSNYTHYKIGTGYEPSQRLSADEGLWIQEMMNGVGAALNSDYFSRLFEYDNAVRTNNSADWAFTLFVIDYSDYGGSSWYPYAYFGGPFAVVKSPADVASIAAHEMGHIFNALDEYSGTDVYGCSTPSDCTVTSGILNVENQNCQLNCTMNVNSLMRSATMSAGIDQYTAGQIGWRDFNTNIVTDSIDYSYNSADLDTDGDGIINYWDLDDDNDSITDVNDACPKSFGFSAYNGCSPPSVTVNANATSIMVGDTIKISANAADNFKVTSVKLFLDGVDTSWSCTGIGTISANCFKDLSYGTAGSHTFYATARDDNNITRDPTSGEKSFTVNGIILPSQVNGTTHTFSNFKNVLLTWNPATAGTYPISYYNVYRGGVKIGTSSTANYTDSATAEVTAYSYQISAVDTSGNEGLKSAVKSLYTGPLMIMSVSPGRYAVNVPINTTVTVTFSIPVDKTKAETSFHMYTQPAGPYVLGSFSWPNNKTMIFTPAAPLDPTNIFYSCEERGAPDGSRGVQTVDGLKLAAKDYGVNIEIWNYIWSFTNRPKWP